MKTKNSRIRWLAAMTASVFAFSLQAVDYKAGRPLQDRDIVNAIEQEFRVDDLIPFDEIDVRSTHGIVSLEGQTSSLIAKSRATLIAETVRGVRSVSNQISVRPDPSVSPDQLTGFVTEAFMIDPVIDSYEIEVDANEHGVITLVGTVDSWQEKQLANLVASGVTGVTAITDQIEVLAKAVRPDHEIKAEIEKRLDWSVLVDDSLIEVDVRNEGVTLSGAVGSVAEKREAADLAWVDGVNGVDASSIKVERWARDSELRQDKYLKRPDSAVLQAIEDAFLYDPRVTEQQVDPEVEGGWVTLRGDVDNILAKEAAETVARNTVGVDGVTNLLEVRLERSINDHEIESAIESKLGRDPWDDFANVNAQVDSGKVILTGVVTDRFAKSRAESFANAAKGVKEVDNHIETREPASVIIYDPYVWKFYPQPWRYYRNDPVVTAQVYADTLGDRRTARKIAEKLFWSPYIDHEAVTIVVENGIATLSGTVQSKKEKDAATESAFEAGARAVENELEVQG